MANRLKKLAVVQYTPGSPYVPGTPAYCTTEVVEETGVSFGSFAGSSGGSTTTVYDSDELTITMTSLPSPSYGARTTTREVCYPAVPETPAGAPSLTYSAFNAWNGGGRSIDPLLVDGLFRFEVSPSPSAVVVGLVGEDVSTSPGEATHAFYVHGTVVDIMEAGVVVATSPNAHDAVTAMTISREAGVVTYVHDGWIYTSVDPSYGPVYLDASIYASGDYVDNPERLTTVGVGTGGFAGTLPPLEFRLFEAAAPVYGDFVGRLPSLFALLGGTSGGTGEFAGSLPTLAAMLSDHNYAEVRGELPALLGDMVGGYPEVTLAAFAGALPPLAAWHFGLTGGVGSFAGALPPLAGQLVDRAGYGAVQGTLPSLVGMLLKGPDSAEGSGDAYNTYLIADDYLLGVRRPTGQVTSRLELGDVYTLGVLIEDAIFDTLALGGSASGLRTLAALVRSGLLLGGDATRNAAAQQYAVNVMTSALTTYSGFDFGSFALADGRVYASRADGVYLLRPGDDDGNPIGVRIDFGGNEFGSIKAKHIDTVFLGLATDGDVRVVLRADGVDRFYRAIQRGPVMRVDGAKGVAARRWNLVLEVDNATELELDALEYVVNISSRRLTK